MKKEPAIVFSVIGLVGYITFHGHRSGVDCWMCKYRGMVFLVGSVALGAWIAYSEN